MLVRFLFAARLSKCVHIGSPFLPKGKGKKPLAPPAFILRASGITPRDTKNPSNFLFEGIGIRQRPTLPGRFQPSTISVLRLNFCVRYGNRWNPQAIITGNCMRGLVCAGKIRMFRMFRLIGRSALSNVQAYWTITLLDVQAFRFCRFTSALPIALPVFRFAFVRRFRARFSLSASLFRQPYALRTSFNPTHLENCTGS